MHSEFFGVNEEALNDLASGLTAQATPQKLLLSLLLATAFFILKNRIAWKDVLEVVTWYLS